MNITFDIGGTNLRAGLFSEDNRPLEKRIEATPERYEAGLEVIASLVDEFSKQVTEPGGTSVAVAGILSRDEGTILVSPNLSDWEGKSFRNDLVAKLGKPVILENDAVAAALGEAHFGAGRGKRIVAYLTISSGVGGAKIVDGKVDANAWGFEPGSQIISLNETATVGKFVHGSLESFASGTAFEKRYGVSPKDCRDLSIWEDFAKYLAVGLANVIVLWSPDVMVLGGGVSKAAERFLPQVQKLLDDLVVFPQKPPIVVATLGDEAGLYGGLMLLSP